MGGLVNYRAYSSSPFTAVVIPEGSTFNGDSKGVTFLTLARTDDNVRRYCVDRSTHVKLTFDTEQIRAVCFDPNDPNRLFLATRDQIHSTDGKTTAVIAGNAKSATWDRLDGVGEEANFSPINEMICSGRESLLFVLESAYVVREVGVSTRRVLTRHRTRGLSGMCWDTTHGRPTYTGIYHMVKSIDDDDTRPTAASVVRYDVESKIITSIVVPAIRVVDSSCMVCTIGGFLIVACEDEGVIYTIDTHSYAVTRIAGGPGRQDDRRWDGDVLTEATFCGPSSVALIEADQVLVVTEPHAGRVRSVPLPPHLLKTRPLPEPVEQRYVPLLSSNDTY